MNDKDINIKTTCTENKVQLVLPKPPAKVIAAIVGVSPDYVKKVRTGTRRDKSEKAALVLHCHELIIGGQEVLVKAVIASVEKLKNDKQKQA